LFKLIFRAIFALGFLVIALAAVVYWQSNAILHRVYHVAVTAPRLPTDAGALARGRHLAQTRGCFACHGDDLGGAKVMDDAAMGRLYGPNLTLGRGGLTGDFSNEDFERAIRHGVGADGRGLYLMPSVDFSRFTVEDMADLIAYVRSAAPVDRPSVALRIGPVARALLVAGKIKISAAEIDHATVRPEVVERQATPAYGRYVAISCSGCHGSNYSGGKIEIGPPDWPPAANLTPDPSGRLSGWTQADFIATLRTGHRPDGSALNPVMPRAFAQMDDVELKALWSFFRTLPPVPTGVR
jgi:mono/diheme cytochrome c family protein